MYLPPEESKARAAKLLYENTRGDGVDWRERLDGFVSETERFFGLLEGVMPAKAADVSVFIDVIGMPLTPVSYAGVAWRGYRRAVLY